EPEIKSLLTCAITENHRTVVSKEYRPEGRELTAFSGDESTATEKNHINNFKLFFRKPDRI
uniref:hypothetical protein n=1 Tax=Streptomyces scabiei TaxID=1930 RepID=UPI0038F69EE6